MPKIWADRLSGLLSGWVKGGFGEIASKWLFSGGKSERSL